MKKNILKIGVFAALSLGGTLTLNSCRDAIDIIQDGEITDERFFSSVGNMEKFLLSIYDKADSAEPIFYTSVLTDEVKRATVNNGHYISEHRLIVTSENALVASFWRKSNELINFANRLIKGAEKITPQNAAQTTAYNKTLAEARVLRAFAHMQLLTYFSENMADDSKLGSILFEDVPTISTKLPRNTNAEVYAAIEADLDFAYDKLDNSSRYRVSKSMVDAMRARIALYRGKYAEAKTHAEKAISNSGLALTQAGTYTSDKAFYAEASESPYKAMWSDNQRGEVIFALSRPVVGGSYTVLSQYYNTNRSDNTGAPMWAMGYNLYNILKDTPGDIRIKAYLDPTSTISNPQLESDDLIIDKYPGKGASLIRNDIKVFRISEMKFIIAEVQAREGDLTGAATTIKEVRDARNTDAATNVTLPVYANLDAAIDDILKERRVELAFEGHRLIDLKRTGKSTDRNNLDDIPAEYKNLNAGDHRFTLPIPLREIATNPNIKQNTGY